MPEGNEHLYPARNIRQSANQIHNDPDLLGILVDLYVKRGLKDRARQLREVKATDTHEEAYTGRDRSTRVDLLTHFLKEDKSIRREYAVEARKFMSEREAGRKVEDQRLRRGRAAQVVARSQRVQDASTGSPMLTSARGRASSILNQNLLGATGQLG